jgi:methylenetetrahydrofolate--tRNA-(uracil-5-)-methyltransferase
LLAGRFAAAERHGEPVTPPPATTAHGALLAHITGDAQDETFQPMNVNFGLLPPLEDGALEDVMRKERKRERRRLMSRRALSDIAVWFSDTLLAAA